MFYSPRLKFHLPLAAPKESLPAGNGLLHFPGCLPSLLGRVKLNSPFILLIYCVLFTCVSLCGYVRAGASALGLEEYTGSPEVGIAGI